MKIQIIFAIFFYCYSYSIAASNEYNYDDIFYQIKLLEYEKAETLLNNLSDKNDHYYLEYLLSILYQGGDAKFVDSLKVDHNHLKTSKRSKSLYLLAKGYYELYTNSSSSKSFAFLTEGYNLAKEVNYIPLQKQFLLGILELYHWQLVESNKQYEYYLEELLKIAEDQVDLFWHELYLVIFKSKTITDFDELSSDILQRLDLIVSENFSKHSKLLLRYYYEKAIFSGFDNDLEKSKHYYQKIIDSTKLYPFMRYMTFGSYIRLSAIEAQREKFKLALTNLDSAKNYIDKISPIRSNIYINKTAANYYVKLNQFDSAYFKLQKSIENEYQLDYKENTLEVSRLNIKYKTLEKEKQILIEQQKKKKNQNIAFGLGGSLVLGSIIAILIYRNTKRKQRIAEQEKEIQIQKTEKILKDQELVSIDAMLAGQEKERQRLANDLHDSLGGTLATVKLHFEHLKSNPNHQDADLLYTKTEALLQEAYQKVRTIAHEKNSGVMANQGLLPAIKNLAKKVSYGNHLTIDIQDYGLEQRLDNHIEITIFRIIQELITNIIKHANATEIQISLTNHDAMLNIIVEDNGKGFDAKKLPQKEGMGLATIEKRIEHLEGTFEIDSTPGKGTNIIINIPI